MMRRETRGRRETRAQAQTHRHALTAESHDSSAHTRARAHTHRNTHACTHTYQTQRAEEVRHHPWCRNRVVPSLSASPALKEWRGVTDRAACAEPTDREGEKERQRGDAGKKGRKERESEGGGIEKGGTPLLSAQKSRSDHRECSKKKKKAPGWT